MQYLISDAEPELINNLTTDERNYQLDFIHFIRDIGYSLWSDNKLNLKTRKKNKKNRRRNRLQTKKPNKQICRR